MPETESGPRTAKHINMHVDQGAVTIGILALLATVIRAPLFPTGIAFLIMLVAFSAIWGRVIPTRVGVTVDGLELQAPLRRVRLSWDDIESGVFIVDEKNGTRPSSEWARRYYNVHLFRRNGRRVIAILDGPIAQRIMPFFPGSKGRLRVFAGARLLGERPLDAHP